MTKANVMALNVQVAPVQEAGKGIVKSAADGSSKGNFDEALGRLQQEARKEMASAGREDTSKGKDTGDGGSGREGVPQSPLAMVMTLPLQQLTAAEVQAEAPAVVVDFTDEAPVSGDLIKTVKEFEPVEEIPARNLRSLLPQSDEAAVKNKDFLAMLSGDLTSSQRAEARSRSRGELLDGSRSETLSRVNAAGRQVEIPVAENDSPVFMAKENERLQLVQREAPLLGKDGSAQAADTSRNLWQLGRSLQESEPADPLGMALRQAARPVKQEAGTETAASVQQVKDGYVQAETKVGYVQAEAKAGYVQAAQPHFSALAASEPAAPKNESWQAVLGDDIKVEAAEPQPLRVLRSQEGQGQMSFGQDRGSNSSASQWVSASMLEAEEPAAPVPSQAASQQPAVPAAGFQQLLQDVADVKAVQTTQDAPETQTDYEVPRQIVEQARLIRSGGDTEMVIHLKPEHLGDLTLKISVTESGAVNASFHSDNAQVRTIIENSLVQLKQELSDQGLKVDSVEVFSGLPDGQLPQGQGQQAWQQGQQGRFAGERKPEDYAEEVDDLAAAALAQGEESAADDGVDYRI